MPLPPCSRTGTAQRARSRLARRIVTLGALLALMMASSGLADDSERTDAARAELSANCRAIRARARLDASLLIGPRLSVTGLRFPGGQDVDFGPTIGNNMQIRIGLTVTPFEIYRGIRVLDSADVECRLEDTATQLAAWLQAAEQSPESSARRAQGAYLAAHRAEWSALIEQAQARREANVITVLEFNYVQSLVTQLERKLEQSNADSAPAGLGEAEPSSAELESLLQDYTEHTLERERRVASDHAAEAWSLRITGGIVPLPVSSIDWFGIAELSYNLGGLFQGASGSELVSARREALAAQPNGLVQRAQSLRTRFEAQREQARRELRAVEERLSFLERALSALASADVPAVLHVRDTLTLERYAAESERAYLLASLQALSAFSEEVHASGRTQRGQH